MALTYCILLLAVCGTARWFLGSWAAPAVVFCAVWAIAAIPAIVAVPEFVSPYAVVLVISFMVAALAGSLLVEALRKPEDRAIDPHLVDTFEGAVESEGFDRASVVLLILGCCGLGTASYYVLTAGFSLSEYTQPETWVQLAIKNSIARYQGETEPFGIRLLLGLNYGGALLAGISFARRTTKAVRVVAALPLAAGILITLVTTAKTGALLCLLFAFEAWLAARAGDRSPRKRVHWGRRLMLPVLGVALAAGFVGSMVLRYGEGADTAVLIQRTGSYFVGQMPAMSAWLSVDDWSNAPPTLGQFTFAGAFEMLGIAQRAEGLYEPIGLNEWSAESNVYSALRGLISDFGLPAAWLIIAGFTAAAQACWSRLRAGSGWPVATLFLTAFYAFALWSPVVSVFAYNVIWLAFAMFAIFIWLFKPPALLSEASAGTLPVSTA